MAIRRSPARARLQRELGENITRWRMLQGLSAAELARRSFISRDTLQGIESGEGSPKLDSVLAVLTSLGIAGTFVESTDPWKSRAGRALMDERIGLSPRSRKQPTEPKEVA